MDITYLNIHSLFSPIFSLFLSLHLYITMYIFTLTSLIPSLYGLVLLLCDLIIIVKDAVYESETSIFFGERKSERRKKRSSRGTVKTWKSWKCVAETTHSVLIWHCKQEHEEVGLISRHLGLLVWEKLQISQLWNVVRKSPSLVELPSYSQLFWWKVHIVAIKLIKIKTFTFWWRSWKHALLVVIEIKCDWSQFHIT